MRTRPRWRPSAASTVVTLALGLSAATAAAAGGAPAAAAPARVTGRASAATLAPAGAPFTGRLLVSLRARGRGRAHAAAVGAIVARSGARPQGPSVLEIGLLTVRPPPGESPGALLASLRRTPGVRSVSLERRFRLRDVPNDPALATPETSPGTPPGTPVQWWAFRENLSQAWTVARGDGARVGVIDEGVDESHPEFAGKIDLTSDLDPNSTFGPPNGDPVGHGTHVAGLACATTNNAAGLAGAGYDCHLIIEKSDLTEGSVIQAIVDATDNGVDTINMSFGTDGSSPAPQGLVDAINYAYEHKVVVVAAASDSPVQEQGDPANVVQPAGTGADLTQGRGLSVTSANFSDQRSSFAGMGSEISLAAYGSFYDASSQGGPPGIFSAFPANSTSIEQGSLLPPQLPCVRCRTNFGGDQRYAYLMGTSMAAPQVTGVAALLRRLNPDLSAGELIRVIKQTASRPAGSGWGPDLGWGILNAGAAVDAVRAIDRRAPVSRLSAPSVAHRRVITLRWRGSDPAPPGVFSSGIDHYEIYRETGSQRAVRIALVPAPQSSLRARVSPGRTYHWYSIAVDRAGNREVKSAPDARTRVALPRRGGSSARHPGRRSTGRRGATRARVAGANP